MNILVLGNGFDLAHGLPTKYTDFLNFCEKAQRVYTWLGTNEDYVRKNLSDDKINDRMKEMLKIAIETRKLNRKSNEEGIWMDTYTTDNCYLDEFFCLIENNIWIGYFIECSRNMGGNWIDFESEISKVIKTLDKGREVLEKNGSIMEIGTKESEILMSLIKNAKTTLQNAYKDERAIRQFTDSLYKDLEKLVRALEIYIDEFVNKISVEKISREIENLKVDRVLSFNYSNTYERLYASEMGIGYDYIHGEADVENTIETNNMVLGIDEYLPDDRKDKDIEFIAFKKFYQRIYKGTGCKYKDWVYEIKQSYEKYVKNSGVNTRWGHLENSSHAYKNQIAASEIVQHGGDIHNLFIFGHSLDVTDKDVLRDLILNDNVYTTIFYYERKSENGKSDNGRVDLGQKIANLAKMIGQDELIRKTGGSLRTIKFRKQEDMVYKQ